MPPVTPELLVDDDELEIAWQDGRSDRLMVSFTGIGFKDPPEQFHEFPAMCWRGGQNHVAFITDKNRAWFNRPQLVSRTVETIRKRAAQAGITRITTLGNSMGGYAAILFAHPLGADRAISFVPQFTMDDRVLREKRWQNYKAAMTEFQVPSLAGCMGGPTRFFVLHGGVGRDRKHYLRFPTGPNIDHYIMPLCAHAAATRLNLADRLNPLVAALQEDDDATVARIMASISAHRRDPDRKGEKLHMWAVSQSTKIGHRIASKIATAIAGPPDATAH